MSSSDCLCTALSNSVEMMSSNLVFAFAKVAVGYSGFDAEGYGDVNITAKVMSASFQETLKG